MKWEDLEKEGYKDLPYTARIALEQSKYKEPSNQRLAERAIRDNEFKATKALLDCILIDNGLKEIIDKQK